MNDDIAYVMAVGRRGTLKKTYHLMKSIKHFDKDAEIYAFVANEEVDEIPQASLDRFKPYSKLIYGNIPMKEYIFTVKHQALIQAGEISSKKYLACMDSDMLMFDKLQLEEGYDLFVAPVDIGNTSWGRLDAKPEWKRLYGLIGEDMPDYTLTSLVDKREMLPYFNGGLAITSDHKFGKLWLETTKKIFPEISDKDSYIEGYSKKTAHGKLVTKIPFSHWTEQVTLSLLASKFNTKILDYTYNYPMNIMWDCPTDIKIMHYHDLRNLIKIRNKAVKQKIVDMGIKEALDGYNKCDTYARLLAYHTLRSIKIKAGKF